MRSLIVAALMFVPNLAWALCPPGQFEALDTFGNRICKSFESGATTSINPGPGSVGGCPTGTHPWVDTYGNKVCKSIENGQEFHDTSRGCPTGSFPSVDTYGNKVCQRF